MKFSHNKKRNTAFIFETLIKELTKATLEENTRREGAVVDVIKKYFSKGKLLKRDLEIYKSLTEAEEGAGKELIEKILLESKKQFLSLDREQIYQEQSKLISEMNSKFGHGIWNNFISNYRKLATVNQLLSQTSPPKKQVMLEAKLVDSFSTKSNKKDTGKFPKINNLAMKNFIEKFNEQYSEILTEDQKIFLSKYITSSSDQNLEFKSYLYGEIEKIKTFLGENKNRYDRSTSQKIDDVLSKVSLYHKRKLDDDLIFEIFKIQTLVSELQKHGI